MNLFHSCPLIFFILIVFLQPVCSSSVTWYCPLLTVSSYLPYLSCNLLLGKLEDRFPKILTDTLLRFDSSFSCVAFVSGKAKALYFIQNFTMLSPNIGQILSTQQSCFFFFKIRHVQIVLTYWTFRDWVSFVYLFVMNCDINVFNQILFVNAWHVEVLFCLPLGKLCRSFGELFCFLFLVTDKDSMNQGFLFREVSMRGKEKTILSFQVLRRGQEAG